MVAAGPGANLLTGCAVLALPMSLNLFTGSFVVSSILAGLSELFVPFRGRNVVSDSARILMLMRDRARGERWLAVSRLSAELKGGALPDSLPPEFVAKAVAVRDQSLDTVVAHAIAYSSAFHQHKDAEAARWLETCLTYSSQAPPALREALMSEAAVLQATRRKRVDLAEQWLAALPPATSFPGLRPKAEGGIREGRGDLEGALSKLEEFEKAALGLSHPAQREATLGSVRRWKSRLQGQLTALGSR